MGSILGAKRTATVLLALTSLAIAAGYGREASIAALFGAGRVSDGYFSVLALVTAVTDLVPGAVLFASLVPVLAPLAAYDGTLPTRRTIVTGTACIVAGVTVLLAVVLWVLAPEMVTLIAPGFDAAGRQTAIFMARGLAWLLPLQALILLFTLGLNAHGDFIFAAALPALSNTTFVAVIFALGPAGGDQTLLAAALTGPTAATAILAVRLRAFGLLGFSWTADALGALAAIWRLARPTLLTLGIGSSTGLIMAAHLMLRRYGSHYGPGAVSALNYGFRIYEVPVSLIANVAATLALPAVATLHGRQLGAEIARQCRTLIRWGTILLLPAVVVALVEAPFLVDLLLHRGRFATADVVLTAGALRGFAPAILFESSFVVFYRVFNAMHRPRLPIAISFLTLACLVLTVGMFGDLIGVAGLASCLSASFAVTACATVATLAITLGRAALPRWGSPAAAVAVALIGGIGWFLAVSRFGAPSWPHSLLGIAGFGMFYLCGIGVLLSRQGTGWAGVPRSERQAER